MRVAVYTAQQQLHCCKGKELSAALCLQQAKGLANVVAMEVKGAYTKGQCSTHKPLHQSRK